MRLSLTIAVAALLLATFACSPGELDDRSPRFEGLDDLLGGETSSHAAAISADGSTVVGRSRSASGPEAFRWTRLGGMEGLGSLHQNVFFGTTDKSDFSSTADDVSADGSIVVGNTGDSKSFLWMRGAGVKSLGIPASYRPTEMDPFPHTRVADISPDGSTVSGWGTGVTRGEIFLWTRKSEWKSLEKLPDDYSSPYLNALSADGSVFVGSFRHGSLFGREAFRWTQREGFVGLGNSLPGALMQPFSGEKRTECANSPKYLKDLASIWPAGFSQERRIFLRMVA